MGCGQSSIDVEAAQQASQSKRIDEELKRARQEEAAVVKCLMLGAGESGTSPLSLFLFAGLSTTLDG
jgi:hypothetical protein